MIYKVAIWGIGEGYNVFSFNQGHNTVEIVVFVDKKAYYKQIDGVPVVIPDEFLGGGNNE